MMGGQQLNVGDFASVMKILVTLPPGHFIKGAIKIFHWIPLYPLFTHLTCTVVLLALLLRSKNLKVRHVQNVSGGKA